MFLTKNAAAARLGAARLRAPLQQQAAFLQALSAYKNLKSKATLGKLRAQRKADAEAAGQATQAATIEGDKPWEYRMLDEDTLGAARDHQLSVAHRMEFQRLYVPDYKLPAQEDVLQLGPRVVKYGNFYYTGDTATPDATKYTNAARKILKPELEWARDSMRQQLDGTMAPKFRQDLTGELRKAVPVPDLDWDCQFPMWNPRKSKAPSPSKGRMQYMFALAKGTKYVFSKMQKGVYTRNGISYRGLA
eukprot:TRINITY_DN10069_c0_g1_i1.p1 TRINITY_DN10069_c0_g1~~TRINITY_DN10069_c0_g1_i1.p1  ORF type:complete len:247 (+),score=114.54 TRINITY_DN10069_c0_g1_i1:299-1039(+)